MPSTKTLRRKILKEIKDLQEKLKAIDAVEKMQKEFSGEESDTADDAAMDGTTVIGVCESLLTNEWQSVNAFVASVQAAQPNTHRAAISTALRRLVDRGVADVNQTGPRKDGYEYKKKDPAAA